LRLLVIESSDCVLQEFPPQKSWNISQLPKLERYLPVSANLVLDSLLLMMMMMMMIFPYDDDSGDG
jgi:hypothetical protein